MQSIIQLYQNAYRGIGKRIWLLAVVMLINRAGTMVLAFLTLYSNSLGFSILQGGWLVAIYGMGSIVGAFLGGKISDIIGFYYTQFLALFLGGLLFLLLGQMETFTQIAVCTFFLSLVNESFRPANNTAIAHYSTSANRTQSFSLIRLAVNVGWGVGIAVGGLLAGMDYHLLFLVDGCTSILSSFVLIALMPVVKLHEQKSNPQNQSGKTGSPFRDKNFIIFCLWVFLFAACFFQLFTNMPLFFKANLFLNESKIGGLMALSGFIIAIFEMILVYKLEGKRKYRWYMMAGAIMMGLGFISLNLPFTSGLLVGLIAILIITGAEMLAMPFMNSYFVAESTGSNLGQYAGMYTMSWSAAQVVGSSAGAWLAYQFGFSSLWFAVTGICFISAWGFSNLKTVDTKKDAEASLELEK